jgi:IS30 family transposase
MRQGRRYGLSAEQKADIWQRWKVGESLHEIGRAFGKDHGSIQFLLAQHGGIAPAVHRRSQRTLTLAERGDISRGIASGWSIREIARGLQRAASTVSREVARHGGRPVYRASEADLLVGTGNSHIATLVERHSRFVILVKVPSKDTATVVTALSRQVRKLPASLRRSLTWDRGLELASHKNFTVATKVNVYFCDPQSPWQRGTNENTNGLLRQYFPKKTDLSGYSQADLDKVARQLNERPRKTLDLKLQRVNSMPVLHRPVETALTSGE